MRYKNRTNQYKNISEIPVHSCGFLSIPADSCPFQRIPVGISGGMRSTVFWNSSDLQVTDSVVVYISIKTIIGY